MIVYFKQFINIILYKIKPYYLIFDMKLRITNYYEIIVIKLIMVLNDNEFCLERLLICILSEVV